MGNLNDFTALSGLSIISGGIFIKENGILENLNGQENISANSIEELTIYDNPFLAECAIESICNYLSGPNAIVDIRDNAPGCNSPQEVQEAYETVSIDDIEIGETFTIFPNPTSGSVIFSIMIKDAQQPSAKIFVDGR